MIFKTLFLIIGIIVTILYALPLVETKLNIGNIFGISVGICSIIIYFIFDTIKDLLVFKILLVLISICFTFFFITLIYIIKKSKASAINEETVIVLGCRVKWDKPSLSLIERCKAAAIYLKKNDNAIAILSGGQGPDESISEAECMKRLMLSYGINKNRLYLEDKSTSTDENIKFSKQIIEDNGLSKNIAIATSEYHQARAGIIAKRYGFNAKSIPCKTLNRVKIPFYTREVFGLICEMIKK